MNLVHLLLNTAAHAGDKVATRYGDRSTTYAEHARRVRALAAGLLKLGLQRGDRVGYVMWNRPEVIETVFACWYAGLVVVPLNPRFTVEELTYHLSDPQARAVVCGPEFLADVQSTQDQVPSLEHVLLVGEEPAGEAVLQLDHVLEPHLDTQLPPAEIEPDELAWLFYTSGTTGRPKGAMLTHGNLSFVAVAWVADMMPLRRDDVTFHAAPLTHGAGFHMLAAVGQGCLQIMTPEPSLNAAATAELLERERVTNTWMVPTQVVRLVGELKARPRPLPALRSLLYGGAPYHLEALKEAVAELGAALVQVYGQGETPMTATYLPHEDHVLDDTDRLASAGIVRTGMRIRITDADGAECPQGVDGEICVQGPAVMKGYWERPEATAEALQDGWLHTGDVGALREGYLYVSDRLKDLIITGGSNVYAKEVEDVILTHPSVKEVAVVGLPDPDWGERVTAVVVPVNPESFDAEALREHCGPRMSSYKRPKDFIVVKDLPLSTYGKVLKRELRTRLMSDMGSAEGAV